MKKMAEVKQDKALKVPIEKTSDTHDKLRLRETERLRLILNKTELN